MPEVTEQGPVGLVHGDPVLLAHRIVRLGQGDGDQPVVVTRHDPRRIGLRQLGQEVEGQPFLRRFDLGRYR